MIQRKSLLTVAVVVATTGCGADSGEPLVASTLVLQFASEPYTPSFGAAAVVDGQPVIAVGTGPLHCGTFDDDEPPRGTNAVFPVDSFALGTYSPAIVQVLQNEGSYTSHGASGGTVTLSAVSEASVAGAISFTYTDDSDGLVYAVNGTFDVMRCP